MRERLRPVAAVQINPHAATLDNWPWIKPPLGDRHAVMVVTPGCEESDVPPYRAENFVNDLERDQRILALTFTNRAKANLRESLGQVLGVERLRRCVTVRNFHDHAVR